MEPKSPVPSDAPALRVVRYDAQALSEHADEEGLRLVDQGLGVGVTWIDVDLDRATGAMDALQPKLGLHALAVADAVGRPQRAKYEQYPTFDLIIVHAAPHERSGAAQQVCLFLGDGWVLTTHRGGAAIFTSVRERLRAGGLARQQGAGYLTYVLLSALVDDYFPAIEAVGNRLESLEAAILGPLDRRVLRRIQHTRRELLYLRRAIWPMREAMSQVSRVGEGRFDERTRPYLRDVFDQTIQAIDLVEGYRDLSSGLVDLYLSTVGFRTNEVMKVLTIISTIFLPLSFIAGVYGMNFDTSHPSNMPELHWRYGYPFVLGLMALTVVGMLIFYRRKGWLGTAPGAEHLAAMTPVQPRSVGGRPVK